MEESQNLRKTYGMCSPTKSFNGSLDLEPSIERARSVFENSLEKRDLQELRIELEDKEREIKKQEEVKKQLSLKLVNVQQSVEVSDKKIKHLEGEHRKAMIVIQGFMKRHEEFEEKQKRKDRKIMDLETELIRLRTENAKTARSSINSSVRRNLSNELIDGPERDNNGQVFNSHLSTTAR